MGEEAGSVWGSSRGISIQGQQPKLRTTHVGGLVVPGWWHVLLATVDGRIDGHLPLLL